jgi:hypothetical protein
LLSKKPLGAFLQPILFLLNPSEGSNEFTNTTIFFFNVALHFLALVLEFVELGNGETAVTFPNFLVFPFARITHGLTFQHPARGVRLNTLGTSTHLEELATKFLDSLCCFATTEGGGFAGRLESTTRRHG